jgi:hypothetical protein
MTERPDPYMGAGAYYPDPLPVAVLVRREREGRTLCAVADSLRAFSRAKGLIIPIPRGYVTDWASVPSLAQLHIQPFGRHAWAALAHDWLYSVGEPAGKALADAIFREKLEEAGVPALRRVVMGRAVEWFGSGGYARAEAQWAVSFRDPATGTKIDPPFARESAFSGAPNGPRPWSGGASKA